MFNPPPLQDLAIFFFLSLFKDRFSICDPQKIGALLLPRPPLRHTKE